VHATDSKPLPEPTPVSEPFWTALTNHQIRIQYSPALQRYIFYPRVVTPGLLNSNDLEWRTISGLGTLYSYTVADRPTAPAWKDSLPQYLAIVEWDCGPRISTELVNVDAGAVTVGMRVRPVFCDVHPGLTMLRYEPE
jgi:uncharacterized OB-fold protein